MVSSAEALYIIESCLEDFRIDGRSRSEHRPYAISSRRSSSSSSSAKSSRKNDDDGKYDPVDSVASPLVLSNGSSRIHLPGSSTDVLCSVKADLVRPSPSRPDSGVCELSVDLSLWGGGGTATGPSGGGAARKRRRQREDESEISSLLSRLVLPHAVDYARLVVWPGRYVWRLSIDVVVLRADGCVLDACSIAMRAALIDARLPRVRALIDGGGGDGMGIGGGIGEGGGKGDLLVDGDIGNARPPPGAVGCPLVVTVSVLRAPPPSTYPSLRQYRSVPIVDARAEEEACASSRVCVSVDPDGVVCGVHTLGGGGAALSEDGDMEEDDDDVCVGNTGGGGSLPLAMLGDVVTAAAVASRNLYSLLDGDYWGDGKRGGANCEGVKRNVSVMANDGGGCYGHLLKGHFLIR
ncbi:hypothetical protein ACHAXA_005587 [Cyclostephanos tholiformis]|uniref:Ribosomal RNA-processing protein 42 n=1 Tax=Cyclostephanos tholiformis TaxID=382380 RepID=A0ABD3SGR7_9STRA